MIASECMYHARTYQALVRDGFDDYVEAMQQWVRRAREAHHDMIRARVADAAREATSPEDWGFGTRYPMDC